MATTQTARLAFPDISPRAWEHPADRAALTALRRVPGLDTAIRAVLGQTTERGLRLMHLASAVRVNERQFARVHRIAQEVNGVFGVSPEAAPEVFVVQSPFLNAGAVGWHKPFIVLNSSLVSALDDDDEFAALYGHELGHILSGHVLYKTLLAVLVQLPAVLFSIPLSGVALTALIMALREWDRKSELSADRAGLLAAQNLEAAQRLDMRLAGGSSALDQMSLDEFRRQAQEYDAADSTLDQTFKLLNLLGQTHPFAVLRVVEIERWAQSEDYQRILRGDYARGSAKDAAFEADLGAEFRAAGDAYSGDFKKAQQTADTAFDEMSKLAQSAADEFSRFFGDIFKKNGK